MAVFPIGMAILPVFSPICLFQIMEPHIQVDYCLIARSQNYSNLPDSWICGRLRAFAGFCGRFVDFCGRFAGNFGRSYVHIYVLAPGIIWEWPGISLERSHVASHVQSYSTCQLWWQCGHPEDKPGNLVELDEILKTRSFQVIFQNY